MSNRKQDKTDRGDKEQVLSTESLDIVDGVANPNAPGIGTAPGTPRPGTGRGSIPGSGMGGGGSPGKENEPGIQAGHRGNKHRKES